MPDFMEHPERLKGGEVEYEFYLDAQGRVTSLKVRSKVGSRWGEQVVTGVIRGLKFPPVPPQVFKDIHSKPPLKVFGGIGWKPR
jgi:outer membrane biosynthesis protein TonB